MMNIRSLVAMVTTTTLVAVSSSVFAQDDLDSLLKDLDEESANKKQPVEQAQPVATGAGSAAVVAAPAEEPAPAKAEEPAPAKAEEPAPAKAEEPAPAKTEEPVPAKKVNDALATVANLAAETAMVQSDPDAELISNIVATEKLRRGALDNQAQREIVEARASMEASEYTEAVRHYGLALKLLNDRPSSKKLRHECNQGIAEGLYRAALQEEELGRRERAVEFMEKAVGMRHPKARRVLEKWTQSEPEKKVDLSLIKHRNNDEDYKSEREQIRKHLRRSRQYLALRDMDKALNEAEIVLVSDPYNQAAIRIREAIQRKRQIILQQERVAARDGMIADVDEAWRPVYAVNAAQLNASTAETVKAQTGEDPERTQEQDIEARMKAMRLPTISFKPPATIIDAVEFFRQASKDYDRPDIPLEKRGFNFVLRTPQGALKAQQPTESESDDFSSNGDDAAVAPSNGLEPIQTITASDITFYEALKLVCDSVNYKFIVRGPVVMVMPKDMSTAELLSRKYDVLEAFLERMTSASSDVKEMKSAGFGGASKRGGGDEGEENQERDWKAFFEQMGVKWPDGSSIMYIKTLGKLYVRNTRENLAEFEKVLQEMGSQPKLIEIETRFVEVSQEDLNSLGFEWILNSDYSLNIGDRLGKALGINSGVFGSESGSRTWTRGASEANSADSSTISTRDSLTENGGKPSVLSSVRTIDNSNVASGSSFGNNSTYNRTVPYNSNGANWISNGDGDRNIGINAFGGTSGYQNGNRYLNTMGNHISGESKSTNDQFMRVNAFLGSADLSMILHMLSQRSDTDLLSAPKVVTKSGEQAVIKVVTEYIYPQDYDVQLQSSSSSGGGSSGGSSQSTILAVVEPQNFQMREVGVILDVTPTYSEANGGTIDLELKPQVVEEPTWKNYGMKIPFTGNAATGSLLDPASYFNWIPGATEKLASAVGSLLDSNSEAIGSAYVDGAIKAMNPSTITYYDAPMEQPFFHVRSIDSKVSITPGSTVVMGGLITEQRKAMDDKIPFLGDLPFIGRLFRSHAEQTIKRNLLIFVTGRLITPSGRELHMNSESSVDEAEVKEAPKAQ